MVLKKTLTWVSCFTVMAGIAAFPVSADTDKKDDIVILYTNDVHSGIDDYIGYDGLALYKREMEAEHAHVILADAGDAIQGGTAANLSHGKNIVDLMNQVGYDVAVLGNHEFDYGIQTLKERASELNCGYISCNFMQTETGRLEFEPYKIIDCGDMQIGFVGAVTPQTFASSNPTFFKNEDGNYLYSFCEKETQLCDIVQQNVDKVRAEGADYVILLAHLGENDVDEQWSAVTVAKATSGIDAVIDGHSHETTPALNITNKDGGNVVITQTGTKLKNIGKMTITKDGLRTELVESVPEPDSALGFAADTWTEAADRPGRYIDTETNQKIREMKADMEDYLGAECGTSDFDLIYKDEQTGERLIRNTETNLMDFCADVIREVSQTEVGFLNGGSLRGGIRRGTVTRGDLINVFPYENKIASVKMTGRQLLDGLEFSARFYPGESGGFLGVSGLEFTIDAGIESSLTLDEHSAFTGVSGEYRVKNVKVNGEPLDLDRIYTVAAPDYLMTAGGDGFPFSGNCEICEISDERYFDMLQRYVRELPDQKIQDKYRNPDGLDRITVINSKTDSKTDSRSDGQPVPASGGNIASGRNTTSGSVAQQPNAAPKTGDAAPAAAAVILFAGLGLIALTAKKKPLNRS